MDFHSVGFIPASFSRTKNSDGACHRSFHVPARRMSAAALSAAVDSTKQQETAPTSQAEPPMQKRTSQTPAALRERGSGGEALLSEKRPLPQFRPAPSLREGARGRGLLYREAPSLAKPLRPHFFREPGFFDTALQPVAAEVVDDEEQGRDRPCDGIAEEHEINVVMTRRDKLHPNDAQ